MATKNRTKNVKVSKNMQWKLIFAFGLIALAMTLLIVQLVRIQKNKGEEYQRIVLNQQGYDSESIPFQRGDILDSKGTILATSQDVYNVILDCKLILSDEKYKEPTVKAILECFEDVTEGELNTLFTERPNSQYCVLRKRLDYEEIQDFVQLQAKVYTEGEQKGKKINPNVKGVWFEKEYIRNYPYDTLASKVLGFTTSGNVGIGGLEDYYNSVLNGVNGRRFGYLNSDSNFESVIKDAIDGNTLVTTLDINIQSIVEEKIQEFDETYRNAYITGPGSKNTAVIVMDPNTGEILAMADSTPYSLNNPWSTDILTQYGVEYKGYTEDEVVNLEEEERLDLLNALWQNFCITHTYEPGSTVKPLTIAAALENDKVQVTDWFECDGGEVVGGHHISCVKSSGHGPQSLEYTLVNSCNDALMQIGRRMGVDIFTKYQNIFNMGLKTNIDLPGEARTDSLIYTADNMDVASLATNSFGQNFNVTMVQVASAVASVINGGYYYQPHIVKQILDDDGEVVKEIEPVVLKQTISEGTSDILREFMVTTVEDGSAAPAKVAGYSMGGKTGTAEKQPRSAEKFLVSFIGFVPAENPEVLIYVVINEPNQEKQSQSVFASTIAKEILEEILPYLNIYPDEPIPENDITDVPTE